MHCMNLDAFVVMLGICWADAIIIIIIVMIIIYTYALPSYQSQVCATQVNSLQTAAAAMLSGVTLNGCDAGHMLRCQGLSLGMPRPVTVTQSVAVHSELSMFCASDSTEDDVRKLSKDCCFLFRIHTLLYCTHC